MKDNFLPSLLFKNIIFFLLQPGLVAGLIPFLIIKDHLATERLILSQIIGMLLFSSGLIVTLYCIFKFAVVGRGTLSPAFPTKRLVTAGLYGFSRNPMYIGVMMMLTGETIFFTSVHLLLYSLAVWSIFNMFIALREEPRLRRDFRDEYEIYSQKVRRWL